MMMMMMPVGAISLVMAALSAPLASAGAGSGQGLQAAPCQVEVPEGRQEEWQEVRAEGFTFCVPGDWRADGARGWQGRNGSVTWGTGDFRQRAQVVTEVVEVRVEPGMSEREMMRAAEEQLGSRGVRTRNLSETVDGKRAEMWQTTADGTYSTGARWEQPRVYLTGRAQNARAARLQLGIYRTVRFAATS